jgi:hypothetical protein
MVRLALVAALVAAGCGFDDSQTCGRGRCRGGSTCISVFGAPDVRQNQGWNDPHYPNVENEWWCVRACPTGFGCQDNTCLQNPTDEGDIVCNGSYVDVTYYSNGKSALFDMSHQCHIDVPVGTIEVTDKCTPMHTVFISCPPGVDCMAGRHHPGDAVPGVRIVSIPDRASEFTYCPGLPGDNQFAPWLPQGKRLRVYVDNNACPGL